MEGLVSLSDRELDKIYRKNALLDVLGNEGQQIVVVGDTSTGKSTIINFLLGFPINFEATGIGTRRPCVLTQVQKKGLKRVTFEARFCKAGETINVEPTEDARQVAGLVATANNHKNVQYFDCLAKDCDDKSAHDNAFDHEPVYVKMAHEDFKYGLRLIDLPGLTRSNEAPMHIAETYIQPGNVAILVIGKDNANNGGFPQLAECMTKCSQVLVIQNFTYNLLQNSQNVQDNFKAVKNAFESRNSDHAKNLTVYCVDFGKPKIPDFVNDGRWKESTQLQVEDQEDWQEWAASGGLEVQQMMYFHASRWGQRLQLEYPMHFAEGSGYASGIAHVIRQVIAFQIHNIDEQIVELRHKVQRRIEHKEDALEELEAEVEKLKDPPEWQDLLAKLANVVSEFLDTTIAIPDEKEDAEVFKSLQTTQEEVEETLRMVQTSPKDPQEEDGDHEPAFMSYWFNEDIDYKIKELVSSECELDNRLACLRSWHRLLDELTAMLAFAPMPCVNLIRKKQAFTKIGGGAGATINELDTMVELVSESQFLGKQPVSSLLGTFKKRFTYIARRDLKNAVRMFKKDLTHEIRNFLRLIGDTSKERSDQLLGELESGLLQNMQDTVSEVIDGIYKMKKGKRQTDVLTGRFLKEERSGLRVRIRENQGSNRGPCHWLIPFKAHYVNGQIPWQDLCMTVEGSGSFCEVPQHHPQGRPDLDDEGLLAEVLPGAAGAGRGGATVECMNAVNAVNLRIFELATAVYDIPLGFNSEDFSVDLEVLKMLKAMQAEIAAFWASAWKRMLQRMQEPESIAADIENAVIDKQRENGTLHSLSNEIQKELTDSYKRAVTAVNAILCGDDYGGNDDFPEHICRTTLQEIQEADTSFKKAPWPGLDIGTYKDLMEAHVDDPVVGDESFPISSETACAGQMARMRLCEEFIFVILQLAMKRVSHEELAMARASSGKAVLAGPFEIVTKLVLHRLQCIGQDSGNFFKVRMMSIYNRDLKHAMKPVRKYTLKLVHHTIDGYDFVEQFLRDRTADIVDQTLGDLQAKFKELLPFDFSILNGRLPLLENRMRELEFDVKFEGGFHHIAVQADPEEVKKSLLNAWNQSLQDHWPDLTGRLTVHEDIRKDMKGLSLTKSTNIQAFGCLNDKQAKERIGLFAKLPDDNAPSKGLAGGAFHSMLLRIHKAMHVNAIDFCRPKLKEMMAFIYQEDHVRHQLQRNKFLARRTWEEFAKKKVMERDEIRARIEIMERALEIAEDKKDDAPFDAAPPPPMPMVVNHQDANRGCANGGCSVM